MRILLVDDDRSYLETLAQTLALRVQKRSSADIDETVTFDVAASVKEALELHGQENFDTVIVDYKMPGLVGGDEGGLEFIKELRSSQMLVPIIILTGYGTLLKAKRAIEYGVSSFIEKKGRYIDELEQGIIDILRLKKQRALRVLNPFSLETGFSSKYFAGRADMLEDVEIIVDKAIAGSDIQHVLIVGESGSGRSAFLERCQVLGNGKGLLCVQNSCSDLDTSETDREAIGSWLIKGFIQCGITVGGSHRRVFRNLREIELSYLGIKAKFETGRIQEYGRDVSDHEKALLQLWGLMSNVSSPVICLVDDFVLDGKSLGFLQCIFQIVTELNQSGARYVLIIASDDEQLSTINDRVVDQRVLRRFRLMPLPPLEPDEILDAIRVNLEGTGVDYSSSEIQAIGRYASGNAYKVQVMAHFLYEYYIRGVEGSERLTLARQDAIDYCSITGVA